MNPAIIKNIIYPVYRFIRHDNVYPVLRELEKNQWLSGKELQDLQWEKLKQLLDYAYKNIPYYTQLLNELGLKPHDIQAPSDFRRLPVLTKDTIRKNRSKMITTDPARKGESANTGGSTGEPLFFYKDVSSVNYSKASLLRINKWCGVEIGDSEAVFWGTPFDISKRNIIIDRLKKYIQNMLFLSTFDMSDKTMLKYANTLQRFKPKLVRGYPSALFAFAHFLKKNKITDIKSKAVISTGEKSFPFQKELLKEVFGCDVFERYGSNEFGNIAHECDHHHGLHIISDMNYVEVLKDDKPAEKGEVGEIVVTSLINYYMPFLRYKIGDSGMLTDTVCSCGRGFPLMEEVVGRSFDMIVTPSGQVLGGFFWTFISRAVKGIKQFQVAQKERNRVEFKIVPDDDFKKESIRILQKEIREKAGNDLEVDFKIVDSIPLTPSGKLRFVISDIARERMVMKSKIHKAVVTGMNLDPVDSVTVDEELMGKAELMEYEKVLIVSNTTGARLETFVVKGKKGSGVISMNGATTQLIKVGHEIIIMSFAWTDENITPKAILVDGENKFVQYLEGAEF